VSIHFQILRKKSEQIIELSKSDVKLDFNLKLLLLQKGKHKNMQITQLSI